MVFLSQNPERPSTLQRRQALKLFGGAMVASAFLNTSFGVEPLQRPAPGRLRLSLSAFSLRDLLTKPDGMDLFQFVDYCYELGLSGTELTSYYFPEDLTEEYLVKLKQHCHLRGITISGGAIRNDFCQADPVKIERDIEHTQRWIDRYALLGAPAIRIFAGEQPKDSTWEETVDRCVKACETVAAYAEKRGVYLALENHGGVTAKAEGLLEIVQKIQAKSFGINWDSGNFRSTGDPYRELELIARYAVNVQIKVEMHPNGQREDADLPRVLGILRNAGYSGWVALEYEADEDPLQAIPRLVEQLKPMVDA